MVNKRGSELGPSGPAMLGKHLTALVGRSFQNMVMETQWVEAMRDIFPRKCASWSGVPFSIALLHALVDHRTLAAHPQGKRKWNCEVVQRKNSI